MEATPQVRIGPLLRDWRRRRRLSQLDLALRADSSARHLSCVETGRAMPSRGLLLRLCEAMDIPLRERNALLLSADYAPAYRESSLQDADMASVRAALNRLLTAHEPYPAVVVDRVWNVLAGNRSLSMLTDVVSPTLMHPRPNVFRLILHPNGLAPRLVNLEEVRELTLAALRRQVVATGDPRLEDLYEEISAYPRPEGTGDEDWAAVPPRPWTPSPVEVPLRLRTPRGELALFSTMTTFGAPADVTLSELGVELFYPLDDSTERALRSGAAALA
ncbi:helix-turn-helix transcriptional regulator [Streptomyces sp. NPDC020875]|uniref:helix-turn-helix transcriptional regulator n=1 Tax=Streptomyces sp. NPDC020875 TaxID=3154898 RepID=UPI0033EBFA28